MHCDASPWWRAFALQSVVGGQCEELPFPYGEGGLHRLANLLGGVAQQVLLPPPSSHNRTMLTVVVAVE
jgi:hypothetical protein